MSILITGMEMPKFCRACRFAGFGGRNGEMNVCMFTGESQPTLSPERMSKCPLVEVQPHGRLIDGGAMERDGWWALLRTKTASSENLEGIMEEYMRLDSVPTVIEAEEGEA